MTDLVSAVWVAAWKSSALVLELQAASRVLGLVRVHTSQR